jgi:MFS family permease
MYGFRKPFTASSYKGLKLWGVQFKIMLVTAQAIGYTISKFAGIKIISELNQNRRGFWIIVFIAIAELTLILFGATPHPYNVIWMFLNGLPLGMIWGLVFSFLEGRRTSEILGCGMAVSFIVSSGIVKSIGKSLLNKGISQWWMPATVGAIFFIPLVLSTLVLESVPAPNEDDVASRTERVQMTGKDRTRFFFTFWPGLILWVLFMVVLTAYRDFRDNFAPELWEQWGYSETPSIYSVSEIIVACVIIVPIGLFMFIPSHIWTLISYHILIAVGLIVTLICTIICDSGKMSGVIWMIITGVGLYLGYIPFNSIMFDCFLSAFKYRANTGFLMYICDACGYLSSIAILFVKNFAAPSLSWANFFMKLSYYMCIINTVIISVSLAYYIIKYKLYATNGKIYENGKSDTEDSEKKEPLSNNEKDISMSGDSSSDK